MNFLLPDVFSSASDFLKWFDFNASSSDELKTEVLNTLRRVISPFFLRRVKSDIDVWLPMKREVCVYVEMTQREKEMYGLNMNIVFILNVIIVMVLSSLF